MITVRLKVRRLNIQAGRSITILGGDTADILGLHSSDRVKIAYGNRHLIAIVNIAGDFPRDHIGLYEEVSRKLKIKTGAFVEVQPAEIPEALSYVQAKIRGERLRKRELDVIVEDVVTGHLSDAELASFVTALHLRGLSMNENEALSRAMVKTGNTLDLGRKPILDKHSIGGVPGDKTSMLIVPIVAAAGFTVPKTSSRAVTSPAGTADRVEVLCPVDLTVEEIRTVVNKTNGCMVWGGALELAPADDIFIQVEYPLAIDPLLLPSIMSKKKAIGATHLVIDIPTGRGSKIGTISEADALAHDFIDLGKRLGMTVQCALTFGEQPVGCAIGPALEAREALSTIMGKGPSDLKDKATSIAGMMFEMMGVRNGREKAEDVLESGKAEQKLREIVEAQGGNPRIKPEEIAVGDEKAGITASSQGRVLSINNADIVKIAREAGAPREKKAGVLLKAKIGESVNKGEVLFEIYAERGTKVEAALKLANRLQPMVTSKKAETKMIIGRIPEMALAKKPFVLER